MRKIKSVLFTLALIAGSGFWVYVGWQTHSMFSQVSKLAVNPIDLVMRNFNYGQKN